MSMLLSDTDFKTVDEPIGYLVVGSSGTGKSSLINLFTKRNAAYVESGSQAGTHTTHSYDHKNGKDILIDTVGLGDPNGISDRAIMVQTLRYLRDKNIKNVAILWVVEPNTRASQPLQTQAKYINSFADGLIWHSTIIIIKKGSELTMSSQSQGALSAADEYNKSKHAIPVIAYNCVDWLDGNDLKHWQKLELSLLDKTQMRHKLGYYYHCEVKYLIDTTIDTKLDNPSCRVIFNNCKCTKCGEVGDSRCMSAKCHSEPTYKHPGNPVNHYHHTGSSYSYVKNVSYSNYHSGRLQWYHPGVYRHTWRYFAAITWDHEYFYTCCDSLGSGCRQRYSCCNNQPGSTGCKSSRHEDTGYRYSCCGRDTYYSSCSRATQKYDCCGQDMDSRGCIKICKTCGGNWNDSNYNGCGDFEHLTQKM